MRDTIFASVVNGPLYRRHFKVLIRSILDRNRNFRLPFVLIFDDMAQWARDELRKEYAGLEFWQVPREKYHQKDKSWPGYFSFEIANPKAMRAKRVVFLDADMVCDNRLNGLLRVRGRICMTKEPRYSQFSAAIMVVEPSKELYDWLHARNWRKDVNNGCGTDQNIWNQYPDITQIPNNKEALHRWGAPGYDGAARPVFWHYIAKYGRKPTESPPGSGGWAATQKRPKELFETFSKWKPLYEGRPFFVFCTGFNCGARAAACIKSLLAQTDPNWRAVIVNDGSTDDTGEQILGAMDGDSRFMVIAHDKRKYGPFSRCEAVRAFGDIDKDDVIVQLDLDDELSPDALTRIRLEYRGRPGVWMTYGNLCDQHGKAYQPKSPDVLQGLTRRGRMIALAPRTFRAGLFALVGDDAFKRGDEWLPCKFDVAATAAMQEMAGPDRIRMIPDVIYKAEVGTARNVQRSFGKAEEETRNFVLAQNMRRRVDEY